MVQTYIQVGSRYPVNRKMLRSCVEEFFRSKGIQDVEVSVSIVGSRQMSFIHKKYMNIEGPTDVLSFPMFDPTQPEKDFPRFRAVSEEKDPELRHLGDVVVCFPEAVKQAGKLGRMVDAHICFLVEHGLMHLLGFHHE